MNARYTSAVGGLPPQSALLTGRAVFTEAYAVIPRAVQSDIVMSLLPGWHGARAWILARPLSGFAETFAQLLIELGPEGGSARPEPDPGAEGALFVQRGQVAITVEGRPRSLGPGGFFYAPPGLDWGVRNGGEAPALITWIRKAYEPADGLDAPPSFFADEREIEPVSMPETNGAWATTRFMDPRDLRHDMNITIVTLQPGATIPFEETHVMEHGLYVLEGKGVYRLNRDWVEVEAGDFMWLRAYCPQACYAAGPGPFRYLLYKDVNRHPRLAAFGRGA